MCMKATRQLTRPCGVERVRSGSLSIFSSSRYFRREFHWTEISTGIYCLFFQLSTGQAFLIRPQLHNTSYLSDSVVPLILNNNNSRNNIRRRCLQHVTNWTLSIKSPLCCGMATTGCVRMVIPNYLKLLVMSIKGQELWFVFVLCRFQQNYNL